MFSLHMLLPTVDDVRKAKLLARSPGHHAGAMTWYVSEWLGPDNTQLEAEECQVETALLIKGW